MALTIIGVILALGHQNGDQELCSPHVTIPWPAA